MASGFASHIDKDLSWPGFQDFLSSIPVIVPPLPLFPTLPAEIRNQIYDYCARISMSIVPHPAERHKYRISNPNLRKTSRSSLINLSLTCHFFHDDLQFRAQNDETHLSVGLHHSEIPNYLRLYHVPAFTHDYVRKYIVSQFTDQTRHNITRMTMFSCHAKYQLHYFRDILPNLKAIGLVLPYISPVQLQEVVNKQDKDLWQQIVKSLDYEWAANQDPVLFDRVTLVTYKDFACLTSRGQNRRFHFLIFAVTVNTLRWEMLRVNVRKASYEECLTWIDKRKKEPALKEDWEGYECDCELDHIVAWYLGMDMNTRHKYFRGLDGTSEWG